jgi:hypothetical protein
MVMAGTRPDEGFHKAFGTRERMLRLGGILAFLGFLAYGLMFAGFAYEDRNLLEGIGAVGWVFVAFSVLLVTMAVTRRGDRGS